MNCFFFSNGPLSLLLLGTNVPKISFLSCYVVKNASNYATHTRHGAGVAENGRAHLWALSYFKLVTSVCHSTKKVST